MRTGDKFLLADESKDDRQEGISELYYFFRDLLTVQSGAGRTVGRKIGVVQEIVVRKLLEQSTRINERMLFERSVPGFSGATHKVEFVIYPLLRRLQKGAAKTFNTLELRVTAIDEDVAKLDWREGPAGSIRRASVRNRATVSPTLEAALKSRNLALLYVPKLATVSVLSTKTVLASVESKRVGAQIFSGSTKLGSGIQTIEKAKQTSLVAIDADLQFNKVIRPIALRDQIDPEKRSYISIVVLGNGVHWTS